MQFQSANMSWFNRTGPLRTSVRRSASPCLPKELDANACLESFKMHWQQVLEIINKQGPQTRHIKADNIRAVLTHIDQMVTLLLHDVQIPNNTMGPILDYLLTENILDRLLTWCIKSGENLNALKLEQLKLYEILISHSQQELLVHKPILNPLLKLLQSCSECGPVEVEKRLVILLNQICVSLTQNSMLMEFFFSISLQQSPSSFLIFNLLIPFVHREGAIGQQARDALLLCMSLSRKNDDFGVYIADHSNFCPVLATGLSGLYSLLPRKLIIETEDWHRFTPDDVNDIPELAMFLNSLEFCNAVIQVSYPLVQEQLLEYVYQGFLVPVLGPALYQDTVGLEIESLDWPENSTSVDEIIAATAYLDLFIRSVTESSLLKAFLKFIFKEVHEGCCIIETLITRIGTQSRLCLITLALFRTLLELNCEDVMLDLVFRYLIPCSHVMVSQRCRIKDFDIYSKTAEKFLALIPACCQPESDDEDNINQDLSVEHPQGSHPHHRRNRTIAEGEVPLAHKDNAVLHQTFYLDYLNEAHKHINTCTQSGLKWNFMYDGSNPSPEQYRQCSLHKKGTKTDLVEDVSNEKDKNCINDIHFSNHNVNNENFEDKECTNSTIVENKLSQNINNSLFEMEKLNMEHFSPPLIGQEIACSDSEHEKHDSSSLTNDNTSDHDSETNIDNSSQLDLDNDQYFWNTLQRCSTPPPGNIEDSLQEIDAVLGYLENTRSQTSIVGTCTKTVKNVCDNSAKMDKSSDLPKNTMTVELQTSQQSRHSTISSCSSEGINKPLHQGYMESFGDPDIGPFLSMLFNKLENMMNNNLYINLQLTGVIIRLAYFPQPLLRSFLLNHTLVFQPTVRSLLQVLGTLKHKLDNYSSTIDNFSSLLLRARKFLQARDERLLLDTGNLRVTEPRRRSSSPDAQKEHKRRSITDFIFRRQTVSGDKDRNFTGDTSSIDGIPDRTGYRYINRPFPDAPDGKLESLKTKNAVLCAVVLEEFLKELSAITQEHAVTELDDFNFDNFLSDLNGLQNKR